MTVSYEQKFNAVTLTHSGETYTLYELDDEYALFDSDEYLVDMSDWRDTGLAVITAKPYEITYVYDSKQRCVRLIEMSDHWSEGGARSVVLDVKCQSGRIAEIVSSDESMSMRFAYSQSGCLTAVNKYSRDNGGVVQTVLYTYDTRNRLVSASGADFAHTLAYDSFGNLLSVSDYEFGRFEYSYGYADERGVVFRRVRKLDLVTDQVIVDTEFRLHDDGFVEIQDRTASDSVIRKLFDLDGRLIFSSENDARFVSAESSLVSSRSAILENGQVR